MVTGTIKWFEKTGGLGYVSVHADAPIGLKGPKVRFRKLSDVEFVTVELEPADHLETIEVRGSAIISGQRAELSGQWRSFISEPTASGAPSSMVERSHLHEAFGLVEYDLDEASIGLESFIGDYGVHVLPVHLGKGLFASIFVNVARSMAEADKQRKDFYEKAAEVSFKIETRYPYLNKEVSESKEPSEVVEKAYWLEANSLSLSADARLLAESIESTARYVTDVCQRIS